MPTEPNFNGDSYETIEARWERAYINDGDGKLHKGQRQEDIIEYFRASGGNFHWPDNDSSAYRRADRRLLTTNPGVMEVEVVVLTFPCPSQPGPSSPEPAHVRTQEPVFVFSGNQSQTGDKLHINPFITCSLCAKICECVSVCVCVCVHTYGLLCIRTMVEPVHRLVFRF
ncbi:unnamed protein product [Hydatigera taeniaeformis]|uniref:Tox-ART-HYD1 domain-containing protein n=1 Tax=Hydatigena taeniaeformis TaxID=6205 RepID=A0A0R3WJM6_HYDTA|nr:unnamed protein product [Hydatigera taeniaeformis]